MDADGEFNNVDEPKEGVEFVLTGTTGDNQPVNESAFTDVLGAFSFGDLWPGEYTVTEVLPPGYEASTPTSADITIASGDSVDAGDFGNFRRAPSMASSSKI